MNPFQEIPLVSVVSTERGSRSLHAHQLFEKAQKLLDEFELEAAEKFLKRAVQEDPHHVEVLETLGIVSLELNKVDSAKQYFQRCMELSPQEGPVKFMYMAQLHTGQESLAYYQQGIAAIQAEFSDTCPENEHVDAWRKRQVSSAYCSIAELFMTDCCFEENAEQKCEQAIQEAIAWDPKNFEAHQLQCSLRVTQNNLVAALEAMTKSLSFWLKDPSEVSPHGNGVLVPEQDDSFPSLSLVMDESHLPPIEQRIQASRLLIELTQYERALHVLDTCMATDSDHVEIWYLIGWTHFLQKSWHESKHALLMAHHFVQKYGWEDTEELHHLEELLNSEELRSISEEQEEEDKN